MQQKKESEHLGHRLFTVIKTKFSVLNSSGLSAKNLSLCCIFFFILFLALHAGQHIIFLPDCHVDGAFQTASGLFRLLNGEFPGKDFFPYIGVMPIYLLFPVFLLSGANFAASLFSSYFLSMFCGIMSVAVLYHFLSPGKKFLSSFIAGWLLSLGLFLFKVPFENLFLPGNSLRPIRQFAPYLCFFVLYQIFRNGTSLKKYIGFSIFLSLLFLWSNDYALGTFFFSHILIAGMIFRENKAIRKKTAITFYSWHILSLAFFSLLLTAGGIFQLLSYNFLDVAREQWWCFGDVSLRVHSLKSFFQLFVIEKNHLLLPASALLLIAGDLKKHLELRKICLFFTGSTLFLGGLTATLGGHFSFYFTYFHLFGIVTLIIYGIKFFSRKCVLKYCRFSARPLAGQLLASVIFLSAFIVLTNNIFQRCRQARNTPHFYKNEQLGGYIGSHWKEYFEFLERNRDKKILEDYWGMASAYLKRNGNWKVDSVIHAFGKTRIDCKNKIEDYDYIITTAPPSIYSYWNVMQNYWFFEKVFRHYDYDFCVKDTLLVWKKVKNPEPFQEVPIQFDPQNNTFSLSQPGWYEVELDYTLQPGFRSLPVVFTPLCLSNFSQILDPRAKTAKFPVYVLSPSEKKQIKVLFTPAPLQIHRLTARRLPEAVSRGYIGQYYLTDQNWHKGYLKQGGGFFVQATWENQKKYQVGDFVILPDGTEREICQVICRAPYLNILTEGPAFYAPVMPHELSLRSGFGSFYLTDQNWEKGYFRKSGGFFVKNTPENQNKYRAGNFIILPDGSRRKIQRVEYAAPYLNVFTDGPSFCASVMPHQLKLQLDFETFYLTDQNWEKGYFRKSGGFFVPYTKENQDKYKVGSFIILTKSDKRKIQRVEYAAPYLNVFTGGPSFSAPVMPHLLSVSKH